MAFLKEVDAWIQASSLRMRFDVVCSDEKYDRVRTCLYELSQRYGLPISYCDLKASHALPDNTKPAREEFPELNNVFTVSVWKILGKKASKEDLVGLSSEVEAHLAEAGLTVVNRLAE